MNILRAMILTISLPIVSTVAFQCEDGGLWTHSVVEEANSTDHHGWSYIIRVTKIERLIICHTRHIYSTPITTEQYLWEQIEKGLDI